ncbi:MAG TPA: serine/threonine-protein kinase [Chthoniobacteraceae bacterium]|nr:serine/threonine-protein kinase [Chthoniobacteraceae bacterium]
MSDAKKCAKCGAELASGAPEGFCPACLLVRGLETQGAPAAGFTPPSPAELARYFPQLEILELLGRGGMGVVYKARQKQLDRMVALKILAVPASGDPAFAERFAREALALARLSHPHIVAVYDSGRTDGLYYFLMEYVDGMNLRQLLNNAKITPGEALAIVPQICEALQYAHDQGIVHRDIKPENILIDKTGHVKIADFGLAKIIGREADITLTATGAAMGTPQYMAPEQIERPQQVDHRADIYSVGVVFYQMLTSELPMGRFAPPSKKVQIDVRLDEVVLRALEKEPDLRWQQAGEVKTQVETIVSTPAQPAGNASPKDSADSSATDRTRRAFQAVKIPAIGMMVLAGLGLIACVVVAYCFAMRLLFHDYAHGIDGFMALVAMVPLVLNIFILRAARRMMQLRGHTGAVCAAILLIIQSLGCGAFPTLLVPAGLAGLACGIWVLVVLNKQEVKEAFDETAALSRTVPHLSKAAIIGACWIPVSLIALIVLFGSFYLLSSNKHPTTVPAAPAPSQTPQ